jgi:hypothetical protein
LGQSKSVFLRQVKLSLTGQEKGDLLKQVATNNLLVDPIPRALDYMWSSSLKECQKL